MSKRTTVLALSLAALAAFALPASAPASWKHKGVAIQQPVQLALTGTNVRFEGPKGGIECQTTSNVKLSPGTTGSIETLAPHPTDATTNCKGVGMGICQIHTLLVELPWTIHTEEVAGSTKILITNGRIDATPTGAFCAAEWIEITAGQGIFGTVDAHKISKITLSGSAGIIVQTIGKRTIHPNGEITHNFDGDMDGPDTAKVTGVLDVVGGNAATYEI